MNRFMAFFGFLLAFAISAMGAAQWQNIHYSTNPVTYAVITNVMGFTGSTATYLRSDGTQATPAGGAVMSGTVSNAVASAGLLSVDATKTNGISATSAHVTTALGFVPQTGSVNLTNWSGVATNTFADGITNAAKAYTDSTTNKITYGAVTNALAATGSSADVLLGNGNWGVVAFANLTNGLAAPNDTGVFLNGKGLWSVPPGGAYAVSNYFITPSTGITVSTNISGTNVTWTISSTATGGGNLTNSGASVVGMLPVYTDTTGTQVTPTNSISLDDVIAGTLSLSNMLANVVPVFDANTNMVPSSMTTNVLDLLYSQSGNITNWGKLTTNEFLPLSGGTVTGPVLSTSPTTNGPTTLELATAGWVRSLLANGSLLFNSTNVVGTAFDASTYKYVGNEPTNGSRSYTPSAGDYVGTVMTTNRYEEVVGPIHITTFFTSSGGAASAQYTLHPEIYYTYDTNSATLLGDYASAPQAITHGAITNQYDFVVSFPPIINTNTPGNGFYIVRRFKIDTKTGTDTLKLSLGTNGVNNTSSHIAFSTPEIAGANWVASGTTNSTLTGLATVGGLVLGGVTNTAWPSGSGSTNMMVSALSCASATLSPTMAITDLTTASPRRVTMRCTLTNNVTTISAVAGTLVDGDTMVWEMIQDGTGSRTITGWDSSYAFGTDITGITLSTTLNLRDFLTFTYNSTAGKWYCVGFVRGY